jgi:hypothetical protein
MSTECLSTPAAEQRAAVSLNRTNATGINTAITNWFRNHTAGILFLLLAFGLAVRLRQYLACPSYWYDEAYLLLNIPDRSFAELTGPLRLAVVVPFLFLWLLRVLYVLFGLAEWAMRLPALLASVTALLVMWPLARRFVGNTGSLVVVALCATSHHCLAHAFEVRAYSSDFLLTEVILLASAIYLSPSATARGKKLSCAALLFLALLAPGFSFTSPFVLGGASLALLVGVRQRGGRAGWVFWITLNGVLLLSALALWELQVRHLDYPGLREHWTAGWQGFPADSSLPTLLKWSVDAFIGIGHYATTGMGIPLLVLGVAGLVVCGCRSLPLGLLLAGPVLLGWLAALLGRYPMGERTVFFAVPCLWLSAVVGLEWLCRQMRSRWAWVGLVLGAALLVPGTVRQATYLLAAAPRSDFRGAFAYVHHQRSEGDLCWVSHPQVYEVYFGRPVSCLGPDMAAAALARQVRGKRLWVVAPPLDQWPGGPELQACLRSAGLTAVARKTLVGLEVVLWVPARDPLNRKTAPGTEKNL